MDQYCSSWRLVFLLRKFCLSRLTTFPLLFHCGQKVHVMFDISRWQCPSDTPQSGILHSVATGTLFFVLHCRQKRPHCPSFAYSQLVFLIPPKKVTFDNISIIVTSLCWSLSSRLTTRLQSSSSCVELNFLPLNNLLAGFLYIL